MCTHGTKWPRVFQPVSGRLIFDLQTQVDSGFRRGFDQGKLPFSYNANACLFRGDVTSSSSEIVSFFDKVTIVFANPCVT
jgi:hypothetical protein